MARRIWLITGAASAWLPPWRSGQDGEAPLQASPRKSVSGMCGDRLNTHDRARHSTSGAELYGSRRAGDPGRYGSDATSLARHRPAWPAPPRRVKSGTRAAV